MIADQVLSSGTNLLLLVLVLRASSGPVFGAFSVALIVQGLLLACSRAMIGEVLLLRVRANPQNVKTDRSMALTLVLGSGALLALVMASVGAFLPDPLRGFFLAMAVAVPFVQVQDLQRYLAFARAQPRTAVALDLGWLVTQVGVSALVLNLSGDPVYLVLSWATGAAISGFIGLLVARWKPSCRGIRELVGQERGRSGSFLSDLTLSTGVAQAAYLGLPAVLTLTGFGLLRFALAVTTPLTHLLAVVRILTLSYFGRLRTPNHRTWQVLLGTGACNASATMAFVGVLLTIPDDVGMAILGELWPQARPLVVFAAIAEAVRVAAFPAIDFLKAFIAGSTLLSTRAVTGFITATALLVGAAVAGPRGALIALGLANLLALVLWLLTAKAVNQRLRTTPGSCGGRPSPWQWWRVTGLVPRQVAAVTAGHDSVDRGRCADVAAPEGHVSDEHPSMREDQG